MFYKFIIVLFSTLSIFTHVHAKNYIDSLETKLILVDNDKKLLILDELIPYYFRNELNKAKKRALKMYNIAQMEGNHQYKIRAQRYLGISQSYLTSQHEIALEECAKVAHNARANGFIEELVLVNLDYSNIYRQIGETTKALEYQLEAYHLADSAEINDLLAIILNNQAQSYIELDDFDKAELCLKKSLKHAKIHEQKEILAETHLIFGDLFINGFNNEYAMEHYLAAHEIYLTLGRDIQIAIALFKIGKTYFLMDDRDKSFQYHLNALAIRNRIKDGTGLAESYNEIGLLCIENGEYKRAINNLKLGLDNADKINSKLLMQQSFDYLFQGYIELEDFEKAVEYQQKYVGISNLIYSEASERKIKEIESNHEIELRDNQIEYLKEKKESTEKQLATSRMLLGSLILLLIFILVSVVIFVRSYRQKKKINKELERINVQVVEQNNKLTELNSTKDKFFSIIGHDLRGPLNSLTSFSQLLINHTASLTEEEIRTVAKDLDKSLKNLYELLDNLLGWARSQTGRIEFTPENFKIGELIRENIRLLSKAALNKGIKMEMMVDEELMVNADINSVRTVIRNLISNAIKFTNEEGVITIFVDEWKDNVEIGIHDTGVGMSDEDQQKIFDISSKHSTLGTNQEKGTGLGLILCKEFIERNDGHISVESEIEVGTTFKFTLSKQKDSTIEQAENIQV